ncbi:MAG: hypothetical protein R3F62_12390 [Planctomycetota bacterium]
MTKALTKGILFDTESYLGGFGASGALRQEALEVGPLELALVLRYDMRRYFVLHTDDDAPDAPTTSHWLTARVELSGPLTEIEGHGLRWIGGVGYRRYFDDTDDGALDFRDYVQFLCGLQVATPELMVSSLTLQGAVYVGEDVFGWTVGIAAGF